MTDPVCGMTVDPATARGGSHEYKGTTYYFCAPGCRQKFAAHPERYLANSAPPVVQFLRPSASHRHVQSHSTPAG